MKFDLKKFKPKRLKIVEQLIIVLLLSIIIPFIISAFIINNINQQAIRDQLYNSAQIITEVVENNLQRSFDSDISKLNDIAIGFKYLNTDEMKDVYLKDALINNPNFRSLELIELKPGEKVKDIYFENETKDIKLTKKINNKYCLVGTLDEENLSERLFHIVREDAREVYIINNKHELLISNKFNQKDFDNAINSLPQKMEVGTPVSFGKIKNQPLFYLKMEKVPVIVVVNTTERITNSTIIKARFRIISVFLITAIVIFTIVGFYNAYLYTNMRQLFKGVIALSKGNYKRKIRLLVHYFTPYEIVFLSQEFNKMASEINLSYRQLKTTNRELKRLDEFRSNLIDTVSHEFRTPLTSIMGYTSRLLRNDIKIDEETKNKSLKIIKKQSERLSRMIEDLLVVPDIEGARLNIKKEEVSIVEILENALLSVHNPQEKNIAVSVEPNVNNIYSDKDRLEQIIINLLDNACKYSYDDSEITIDVKEKGSKIEIDITNKSDYIPPDKIRTLFEKFTRIDDKMTRTTRGTGLGLFIVKGLVDALNGRIEIYSTINNVYTTKVFFNK